MSSPFVWFHHNGARAADSARFFEALLEWRSSPGPGGLTMVAGDAGPFAALAAAEDRYGDDSGWMPFVAVDDVDAATKKALALGATLVQAARPGPAGSFSIVRDPGGAAMGLWKRA